MTDEVAETLAEAIHSIAVSIKYLGTGDASTHFGAIEALAMEFGEIRKEIASVAGSLDNIAEAIRDHTKEQTLG